MPGTSPGMTSFARKPYSIGCISVRFRGARVSARLEGWAAGLMVRDARLRGLLTMRVSLALRSDLPAMANQIRAFGLRQINPTGKSLLIFRNRVKPRNQKYFCFRLTQIRCISKSSRPTRGAIARRHERGAGCGGRESVRRCQGMAGRVDQARELTNGTQTNDALADCEAVWFWHPLLVLNLRRRVGPTGIGQTFNPQMTVTTRIRRRGERGISVKTIARGMPVDPSEPVVTTLVCFT